MLARRLWIRAPHATMTTTTSTTAKAQTWPTDCSCQQTPKSRGPPGIYKGEGAGAGSYSRVQGHGKRQQQFRAYSNYAPKDPAPYYGSTYSQPPKSRASRLKDMAIGSALTATIYVVYTLYTAWQTLDKREEEQYLAEMSERLKKIFDYYDRLLFEARVGSDDIPEKAEKIRNIFVQRALAILLLLFYNGNLREASAFIKNLGLLPRLPENHQLHTPEQIRDEDTVVYEVLPDKRSLGEKVATYMLDDGLHVIDCTVVVAIYASSGDLAAGGDSEDRAGRRAGSGFRELNHRIVYMMDNMYGGTLGAKQAVGVTIILRDEILSYVYKKGVFERAGLSALKVKPRSK
ncbi:hypothetical protein F4825DRAFT_431535 [Nemania diffusa]|nr:hypothetical protein F4825DRAFT_431535 [Nemania diffusa]